MSSTRTQLIASLIANIRSGNADTMAAGVRAFENLMIAGLLNIVDDMNVDGGYLGIQSGQVDISFIKSLTPNGYFLKDDGTWSSASQRVTAVATSTTPTPNIDTTDLFIVLSQASNPTFGAPIGAPVQGQKLAIRITDNGTARTLSLNPIYRFTLGVSAPTTTVISKPLYMFFEYNSTDVKWDCVYTTQASGSTYSGTTDQILINGSNVISIAPTYEPALTATQVAFGDGSNLLSGSANLVFDDSNKRLGINNSTPGFPLDIVSTMSDFIIKTTKGGASGGIYSDGSEIAFGTSSNSPLLFFTNNGSFQFGTYSGLFFIGTGVTASAGAKLHIKGIGTGTDYNIQCFQSDNSTQIFGLQDDGTINYKNQYSSSASPGIAAGAAAGTGPTVSLVGTNKCGVITVITGAVGLVAGTLCTVTYSNSFAFPNGSVVITSGNTANGTTLAGFASETGTTTTFIITTPIALTALTTYKLNYHVEGY